jgi:hypothetical protein
MTRLNEYSSILMEGDAFDEASFQRWVQLLLESCGDLCDILDYLCDILANGTPQPQVAHTA